MKSIMENMQATGQIAKWTMELKAYGIRYERRTTIKGQVLADFIAEFAPEPPAQCNLLDGWVLNVDRVSNNKVSRIGIISTTLKGFIIEQLIMKN